MMNGDQISCASSPRGGLCKALKDMKSKVATHTGISLSFVELVATSPAVGLLPVLPPSPRSPSARLHRWMHHHNNPSSASRRSCTEQTSHLDAELAMETMTCRIDGHSAASPCGYPKECSCHMNSAQTSASMSCGMVSKQPLVSSSCGHPQSASLCNQASGHSSSSSSSSPSCDFLYGQRFALLPDIAMAANGDTSAVKHSYKQGLYPLDDHRGTSYAGMLKQTTDILDRTARVLYFIATLVFGLIAIIKSPYLSLLRGGDVWKGSLCSYKFKHYMRVTKVDTELAGHAAVVDMQQSQQAWKTTRQRSKLLKSKLRYSFKNLSVQVPRKALAPLHLNTSTLSSMSSSSSSSSCSSLSSTSPACTGSPTGKKSRTPKSPSFARRLPKSFNQRASQCSLASGVCFSPPSLCEGKQESLKRVTTVGNAGAGYTMVASLVSVPLALCGLFYSKLVAGGVVTTWLLILSILSKSWLGRRSSSPLCQI